MNKYLTQVWREIWESPGVVYRTPMILFAVVLVFSCLSLYSMHSQTVTQWDFSSSDGSFNWSVNGDHADSADANPSAAAKALEKLSHGQYVIYIIFGVACLFNTFSYLLGSLLTDRADRSVLFFKSMPISEWQVVLTKLAMASVLIPLVYWLCAGVSVLVYILAVALFDHFGLQAQGHSIWQYSNIIYDSARGLVGIVLTSLWLLPLFSALLLLSAAAKKSPLGLLLVVLFVAWIAEKWIFGTGYIGRIIAYYASGAQVGSHTSFVPVAAHIPFDKMFELFARPGLYTGWVLSGLMLTATVWLRNRRFEI